jgi:hypothetical protein
MEVVVVLKTGSREHPRLYFAVAANDYRLIYMENQHRKEVKYQLEISDVFLKGTSCLR